MGAYCIKHSDGNLMKILDMIIETGIDGINPIDPIAGMDIQKIKKMYGGSVCIIGNIDCGNLLTNGTPAPDMIRIFDRGGGNQTKNHLKRKGGENRCR